MKTKFIFGSLRNKVFLSIIVVIAVLAVVASILINFIVRLQMTSEFGTEKEAAIESLSNSLSLVVEVRDQQQIKDIVTASLISQNIDFVAVFDNTGTLIESSAKSGIQTSGLITESHDLQSGGQKVGSFEIAFSQGYIDNLVSRTSTVLIVAIVIILSVAGLTLLVFTGSTVIRPIETITRTIKKFGPGNLSARLEVGGRDEIGELATNFNRVAADLEKSYLKLEESQVDLEHKVELRTRGERRRSEQLRAINEVGRRISSILSLDELLPYVAESLQQTFHYSSVNIFLASPDHTGVTLKALAGESEAGFTPGFNIPFGEGTVGKVAETGKPLNSINHAQTSNGTFQNESGSEIAVPLSIGADILGVLDIESLEPDAFDEIDMFTAQTLGDQLAIAIENARLYGESQDTAILAERNRMAREIHDTLAQGFTGIILQLEAAEQVLEEDGALARTHMDRAQKLARQSLNEARRSVWALRPQELEHEPLTAAMRRQLAIFEQDTGVKTGLKAPEAEPPLSADIENALLRILQEALTNVKKHARAGRLEVGLSIDRSDVRLKIDDDGAGFQSETSTEKHFGLISMRERAKLLGGSFQIWSEAGKGTHLEAIIPIDRKTI